MKNVLITGGSRGIGKACCEVFAKNGYRVFINYKNSKNEAKALAKKIDGIAVYADVSDCEQVNSMVDYIYNNYGMISVLVNNAGISNGQKLFTDITVDEWKKIFCVNVDGMFYVTKKVLPQMIHEKKGKIINMSSIWGITGGSCEVDYSTTKAAVIGFTKSLAKELGLSNIQVNCVAPGMIDTQMNSHLTDEDILGIKEETPLNRIGTAEEIAQTVYFLASDKSDFITGQIISPNGGILI